MDEFLIKIRQLESDAHDIVWWKPEQIERGEHLRDDMVKGERPWIIPETTGQFLYDTIIENNYTKILELGTSIGYSTLWLARAVIDTGNTGHIDTVERSDNKVPVSRQNFKEFNMDHLITLHHMRINEFLKTIPNDTVYDLMFLDADRGHYHEYLPILEKHLSPIGMIIADNAGNMTSRMQPFLDLLTEQNFTWEILDLDNGLLIARKNP
jgi:predicted O-methyltransferase YrrM